MEQIKLILIFIIDVIWTVLMIIPLSLTTLYNELNKKKKDVKGQLALVSKYDLELIIHLITGYCCR